MSENPSSDDSPLTDYQRSAFVSYAAEMMKYWQGYHGHKERMYITATTIFVAGSFAGASYLFDAKRDFSLFDLITFLIGYIALTYAFFSYRNLQLRYKQNAAFIADSFHMQLPRLLTQPLHQSDLELRPISDAVSQEAAKKIEELVRIWWFPKAIMSGFNKVHELAGPGVNPAFSKTWIPPAIGILGFLFAWAKKLFLVFSCKCGLGWRQLYRQA